MTNQSHENQYALHLTNLGESKEILASEDIYNQQGALLVKKGAPINQRVSDQIVKFKLLNPIENSINISDSVTPNQLLDDLNSLLQHHPAILNTHQKIGMERLFEDHIQLLSSFPLVLQKLTVMREQLNRIYRNTLAVTWLSLAIAKKMGDSTISTKDCFFAAICHDFGMLHINTDVISKTESLTPEEWRQIQSHTVIGKKLVDNIPKINKKVGRIILEHHERCDGTGYPLGKFQDKLTKESQIIAFCDSVVSVFNRRQKLKENSIRDLMPFLQVNSESHFYQTYAAMTSLLRLVTIEEDSFINHKNVATEIENLRTLGYDINAYIECLNTLNSKGIFLANKPAIASVPTILGQVTKIIRGSGVLDQGYIRWLDQVKSHKLEHAYREVADVSLMLTELKWHLERAVKILESYIDIEPESDLIKTITEALKNIINKEEQPNDYDDYAIA